MDIVLGYLCSTVCVLSKDYEVPGMISNFLPIPYPKLFNWNKYSNDFFTLIFIFHWSSISHLTPYFLPNSFITFQK